MPVPEWIIYSIMGTSMPSVGEARSCTLSFREPQEDLSYSALLPAAHRLEGVLPPFNRTCSACQATPGVTGDNSLLARSRFASAGTIILCLVYTGR